MYPKFNKDFKINIKELKNKIFTSIKQATFGKEDINTVLYIYGASLILITVIIVKFLIPFVHIYFEKFILYSLSLIFAWHIYIIFRCKPKAPKLTKEEKEIVKIKARKERWRNFIDIMLLRKGWFNLSSTTIAICIDLFCLLELITY